MTRESLCNKYVIALYGDKFTESNEVVYFKNRLYEEYNTNEKEDLEYIKWLCESAYDNENVPKNLKNAQELNEGIGQAIGKFFGGKNGKGGLISTLVLTFLPKILMMVGVPPMVSHIICSTASIGKLVAAIAMCKTSFDYVTGTKGQKATMMGTTIASQLTQILATMVANGNTPGFLKPLISKISTGLGKLVSKFPGKAEKATSALAAKAAAIGLSAKQMLMPGVINAVGTGDPSAVEAAVEAAGGGTVEIDANALQDIAPDAQAASELIKEAPQNVSLETQAAQSVVKETPIDPVPQSAPQQEQPILTPKAQEIVNDITPTEVASKPADTVVANAITNNPTVEPDVANAANLAARIGASPEATQKLAAGDITGALQSAGADPTVVPQQQVDLLNNVSTNLQNGTETPQEFAQSPHTSVVDGATQPEVKQAVDGVEAIQADKQTTQAVASQQTKPADAVETQAEQKPEVKKDLESDKTQSASKQSPNIKTTQNADGTTTTSYNGKGMSFSNTYRTIDPSLYNDPEVQQAYDAIKIPDDFYGDHHYRANYEETDLFSGLNRNFTDVIKYDNGTYEIKDHLGNVLGKGTWEEGDGTNGYNAFGGAIDKFSDPIPRYKGSLGTITYNGYNPGEVPQQTQPQKKGWFR